MGTKNNPGTFDCYAALSPDEPYFLIAGRDQDAHIIVHMWAMLRRKQIQMGMREDTPEEQAQIAEALLCTQELQRYYEIHRLKKLSARITYNSNGYPLTIDGYEIVQPKPGS
jgi:hypothetical protein